MTFAKRNLFRYASIACFVLAILWYLAALFTDGWRHSPTLAWLRRYDQVTWKSYHDKGFNFRVDHLSNWQVTRPPSIPWTKRTGDGIQSEDILVMRYHDPFTFVVVVRYRPEQEPRRVEWIKEAQGRGFVAAGFGEHIAQRARARHQGRPIVEVLAAGPVREKTFRLTSLFIPDGPVAWRVTAGVEAKHFPRVAATLARMLDSFTLDFAPGAGSSEATTRRNEVQASPAVLPGLLPRTHALPERSQPALEGRQ